MAEKYGVSVSSVRRWNGLKRQYHPHRTAPHYLSTENSGCQLC
ncbi:MAG: LysM domain-containing protein [Owenweeksia sp.]|nr:LysM domain-containing protein [Owenweeksia sp.]